MTNSNDTIYQTGGKYFYQSLVFTLAGNLQGVGFSRTEALKLAHKTIKEYKERAFIITYYNQSKGRVVSRVAVLYSDRFEQKQAPTRPGQLIYDDLLCVAQEKSYTTRSAKRDNIKRIYGLKSQAA